MSDFFIDLNDAAQGVGVGEVSESSMGGSASKVGTTTNRPTSQRMKTTCSANRGWKLAVILL